jgi:hypothetical protein
MPVTDIDHVQLAAPRGLEAGRDGNEWAFD